MTSQNATLEQFIDDSNVYIKKTEHGRGLFASRDIPAKDLSLFILRPSMLALDIPQLNTSCYYCYRISNGVEISSDDLEGETIQLKACTGCRVVKFCNKDCQLAAWSRYHKLECKVFAKLYPRILPSPVRAVLRLLKQRKAKLISDNEWDQILGLESHQDEISQAGGYKWENTLLSVQALKAYSNTDESLENILRILCLLYINSFSFTRHDFDPIGCILHPLAAMINHSCDPNAMIRFDRYPSTVSLPAGPRPRFGSISIQALRNISKDEEIRFSYINTTFPFDLRQRKLKATYHFDCTCTLCQRGESAETDVFDQPPSSTSLASLSKIFDAPPSITGIQVKCDEIYDNINKLEEPKQLKTYLHALARCTTWPVHRFPYAHFRQALTRGMLDSQDFEAALPHVAIQVRLVDPQTSSNATVPFYPLPAIHKLLLFRLCRYLVSSESPTLTLEEHITLALLSCALIDELARSLHRPNEGDGYLETVVNDELRVVKSEAAVWQMYAEDPARAKNRAWEWMDKRIEEVLKRERNEPV